MASRSSGLRKTPEDDNPVDDEVVKAECSPRQPRDSHGHRSAADDPSTALEFCDRLLCPKRSTAHRHARSTVATARYRSRTDVARGVRSRWGRHPEDAATMSGHEAPTSQISNSLKYVPEHPVCVPTVTHATIRRATKLCGERLRKFGAGGWPCPTSDSIRRPDRSGC